MIVLLLYVGGGLGIVIRYEVKRFRRYFKRLKDIERIF